MSVPGGLGRLPRWARTIAKVALGFGFVVVLLAVGIIGALRLARVRVFIVAQVNQALDGVFVGALRIDHVARLGPTGAAGVDATVFDAHGKVVLVVRGARAQLAVLPLVWTILQRPRGSIQVDIGRAAVDHVEVTLIDDGTGVPSLLNAFSLPGPDTGPSQAPPPTVRLRSVGVEHAWVHGQLSSIPAVDAELRRARVTLEVSANTLRLQLARVGVRARALPYEFDPEGEIGGALVMPTVATAPASAGSGGQARARMLAVHAWYKGALAGSQIDATFAWADAKLEASFNAPRIEPTRIARLAPGLLLQSPLAVHATAKGTLSDMHFSARVALDDLAGGAPSAATKSATLVVVGRATLKRDAVLDAELRVEDVNLATLLADAPKSRLGGMGHLHLNRSRQGVTTGRYDWFSSPTLLSGGELPAIELEGELRREPAGALTTTGHARILEPGAHTTVDYSASSGFERQQSRISIESFTEVADPERLRSLAGGLRVRGSVDVVARFSPDLGGWTAHSHASLHHVRYAQFSAGDVEVHAEVAGGQHTPAGMVQLRARDISAAGRSFRRLRVDAEGTLEQARLSANLERADAQRLALTSEFGLVPSIFAQRARLVLPSGEGAIVVSVDALHSTGGRTQIDGLRINGAGTAQASLTFSRELEQLELSTDSFDAARLLRLLGFPSPLRAGRATLMAHYESHGIAAAGSVRGRVSGVGIAHVRNADANVDLTLARDRIDGTLAIRLAPGSLVDATVQAFPLDAITHPELALGSLDASLSLHAAMDLEQLKPWILALGVPIDHASGTIQLDLTARGPNDGGGCAKLSARVETRALELSGRRDEQAPIQDLAAAQNALPWSLRGIDATLNLTISKAQSRAEASLRLYDQRGTLIEAQASAKLPENAWPSLRLGLSEALGVPLVAALHMPQRRLQQLPPMIKTQGLQGVASFDATLTGSIADPKLVLDGAIERLSTLTERIAGQERLKLDVSVHAEGSRRGGNALAKAKKRNRPVGSIAADWSGDALGIASASIDASSPLRGNLSARLDHFPLEELPSFRARQFSGLVTGYLSLRDWGRNAALSAKLDGEQLGLGGVVIERASARVEGINGQLVANLKLSGHKSGTLEAHGAAKMLWRERLLPMVEPRIHGALRARGFQIGALSPLLGSSVNELAGLVDAKLDATLNEGVPQVEGEATLSQGVIQVPSIGQRFDSIGARIRIHGGDLRVADLQARGLTGRITGSARARLDGLVLVSGEAHVKAARGEQIPITIEGQAVGDAWGRVDATLERSAATKTTKFRIDVPELHLDLPDLDPRSLQELGRAEHVRIGAHRDDGRFISLPVQPLAKEGPGASEALVVEVHLGKAVWIQKGTGIKVQLAGDLLARVADETTLEGRLELKGGELDLSGKTFKLERGIVRFDGGDPANPSLTATARWDSPGEYRVYAEYTGTVEDGTLKLHSQPPLSSDRLVSLLLFGSPDGTFGADSEQGSASDSTATAVGLAGDPAVKGLNRALSGVTTLDVTARLDTSTGAARPELNVRITPRLTARVTRAIGEPTVGQSPDRTFLTLELRLRNSWALSAIVGDRGASALDLLWRRRY